MLEKVIKQLPEKKYELLYQEVLQNKGEKTLALLEHYRNNQIGNETELIESLNLNQSSFHTLRSRLFSKIQEFLFTAGENFSSQILNHVHHIPDIMVEYPKETSISILKHLENELKISDNQEYLLIVYHALKKLHSNTEKFYTYDQLYNKSVAFTLAQNKAEEILATQCKHQAAYILSGDEMYVSLMLISIQEMFNLTELYDSPKINFLFKISYLNYCIFIDSNFNRYFHEQTMEEIIQQGRKYLSESKPKENYGYELCLKFLSYHYYYSINNNKINANLLPELLKSPVSLSNLSSVTIPYYLLQTYLEILTREPSMISEFEKFMNALPEPEEESETEYIWYHIAKTTISYYNENSSNTINKIQKLINFSPIKKYKRIETEIKLFYTFLLLLVNKTEPAESLIRNINRNKDKNTDSERKKQFVIILNTSINAQSKTKTKRIFEAYRLFNLLASTKHSFLSFIKIHERHILELSMK